MLLTTPEELRQFHPSHLLDDIDGLKGFIYHSEHSFLMEKIGRPLHKRLTEYYEGLHDPNSILPGGNSLPPIAQLINLCQRPIAFDALYRSAGISSVSLNASGLNILSTDGYDAADKDSIDGYKREMYKEAHEGIDFLLVTLEEWAEDIASMDSDEVFDADNAEKKEIIELWKQSRYYYLAEGLFINTARKFNEFVSIYESREKFIQLLPDLRYCQEFILRPELGNALADDLISKSQSGEGNQNEKEAVRLAQYALALKVEERSTLFKRAEAKDEAIGAMRRLVDYLKANQGKMDAEAVKSAPFYEEPKAPAPETPATPQEPWKNNRRGNKLFVTRPIE